MSASTPTRPTSIVSAIEAIESRLAAAPAADVTERLRPALDRLLAFPVEFPLELPPSFDPSYHRLLEAESAWFERNLSVMGNLLLAFVGDCEARGSMPACAWLEALHDSMRDYLRMWFRAYSLEHREDELGSPIATGDWSLLRLVSLFQLAQSVDPAELPYRPFTPDSLVAGTALYA